MRSHGCRRALQAPHPRPARHGHEPVCAASSQCRPAAASATAVVRCVGPPACRPLLPGAGAGAQPHTPTPPHPNRLTGIVTAYGLAWIGHFFVEHNRPATFKWVWVWLPPRLLRLRRAQLPAGAPQRPPTHAANAPAPAPQVPIFQPDGRLRDVLQHPDGQGEASAAGRQGQVAAGRQAGRQGGSVGPCAPPAALWLCGSAPWVGGWGKHAAHTTARAAAKHACRHRRLGAPEPRVGVHA